MLVRAAVLHPDAAASSLAPAALAPLRPHEVLVAITATGVCHTDLTCRDGFAAAPRPVVLGHEGAGVVEAVGDAVSRVAVGDHVILTSWSCGDCEQCQAGNPPYCDDFRTGNLSGRRPDGTTPMTIDGEPVGGHFFGQSSFATHCVASERNAVVVSGSAPLHVLAPLGCSGLTGAGSVLTLLDLGPESRLLVVGAGGVGLSAVMAGASLGVAEIIVIEPRAAGREAALAVGATQALGPEELTSVRTRSLRGVVDTVGIPSMIPDLISLTAPGGKIALATSQKIDSRISLELLSLIGSGVAIQGVRMGGGRAHEIIPHLVDLHHDGRFPLDTLIQHYPLAHLDQAMADLESGRTIKPVMLPTKKDA